MRRMELEGGLISPILPIILIAPIPAAVAVDQLRHSAH